MDRKARYLPGRQTGRIWGKMPGTQSGLNSVVTFLKYLPLHSFRCVYFFLFPMIFFFKLEGLFRKLEVAVGPLKLRTEKGRGNTPAGAGGSSGGKKSRKGKARARSLEGEHTPLKFLIHPIPLP